MSSAVDIEQEKIDKFIEEIVGSGLQVNQQGFLIALVECFGIITQAAEAAGVAWTSHYHWMKASVEYAACYHLADELAKYRRLHEAYRRASQGVTEDIYYQGEVVGQKQVYSDSLLNTIIKGDFKKRYGDSQGTHEVEKEDAILKKMPGRDEMTDEDLTELLTTVKAIKAVREQDPND